MIFTQDPNGTIPPEVAKITVTFKDMGLKGTYTVTDLWSHKNQGKFTTKFSPVIKRHGAGLYRLSVSK